MAGRPHAGHSRGGAVDGGDAPPGPNGGPVAVGPADSDARSRWSARGRSRRATAPIGGVGPPSRSPAAGARAAESARANHRRTRPDRRAPPGAEPAGVDPPRSGRGRAADRGARLEGSVRAARAGDGGSNHVCGGWTAGRMPGSGRAVEGDGATKRASRCRPVGRGHALWGCAARWLAAGLRLSGPAVAAPSSTHSPGFRCDSSTSTGPTS